MKKSNIIVVLIVFLFLGAWLFFGKNLQEEKEKIEEKTDRKLPSVVVQEYKSVKKDVSLEYFGKVFLGRSYAFESQYADKIILNVEKGDRVQKGDVLFSYQNNGLKAQKKALLAEKERLEVEEKALESLRSKNFSSEIDYKTVLENKARIDSSIVSIDDEIRRSTKIAPEDGVVEELYVENSQYVDNGTLLMDFQASENKVISSIDIVDIPKIRLGDEVEFMTNDTIYKGKVDFIGSNIGNDNAGTVIFEMSDKLSLPNGYPGELIIHVAKKDVTTIPIDAALLKGNVMGIYHLVDGLAVFESIEVYKTQRNDLLIKSFAPEIELVVTGQYLIDDSGQVKVAD